MSSGESVFLTYIRDVLKRWTGLQLAIMQGMGGYYAKEKEVWFGTEIENYFKNNADLFQDEVEDFIDTILSQEFDTVAEDGSVKEISSELCNVFKLCQIGKEQEVCEMLSQKSVLPSATTASVSEEPVGEMIEEATLTAEIQNLAVSEKATPITSVDGWVEVRRGRKQKG